MNNSTVKNRNIRVVNAEKGTAYRRYIFDVLCPYRKEQEAVAVFAALNDADEVVGYIFTKVAPEPQPDQPGWYIDKVFVDPAYRRQGIATELFDALNSHAIKQGVPYFIGYAQATERATMFWYDMQFCLERSKKQEDPSRPLTYGNYLHFMHRQVGITPERTSSIELPSAYQIVRADHDLHDSLFDMYFPNDNAYFATVLQDLFGFAVVNELNHPIGFALAKEEEMGAPLDGSEWFVWLYVEPKHRKQGVGSTLLQTMKSAAKDTAKPPVQLRPLCPKGLTREDADFYRKRGFNVAYYGWLVDKETGERFAPWPHIGRRIP